jgi:threonine 3-dehydrogenase
MKALAKLTAAPGLTLTEVARPSVGPNDVLIKIRKAAICGTDIHIWKWDEWASKTIPVPMHVGHEYVGTIVEMGQEVRGLEIGDRVSGEGHITCGFCRNCRAGRRHLCAFNAFKIPDDISDDMAAIFDPFGNATHTALTYDLVGEDVLITGAGPIGIMAAAIARHVGARNVVITDVNDYRLELALKMGANRAVNVTTTSLKDVMTEGFDVGLEMSGVPSAFASLLEHMNHGGKVALLGIPPSNTVIDWNQVIFKGLELRGIYGREMFETWYKMVAMLQSGLDLTPIITHHFPLDQFEPAFNTMLSGQSGKVILDWSA